MAVVHFHAPEVIPFGVTNVPLRPVFHMAAFLGEGVPLFEIRKAGGATDMLIRNNTLGLPLTDPDGHQATFSLARHILRHPSCTLGPT